jgi:hypothetical protein
MSNKIKLFVAASAIYFIALYAANSLLDFWLIVVFSIMFGAAAFLIGTVLSYTLYGSKQKAVIKECIRGYVHFHRRNRNSYVISIKNKEGKLINKRLSYKTEVVLKEGDTIEVFVNNDEDVFIKKDLYFLIPFAVALLIVSLTAFIVNF